MTRLPIAAVAWHVRLTARRIGWQVPTMVVAAIATLWAYSSLIAPLEDSVASVKADADALRGKMAVRQVTRETSDPSVQLRQFYRYFPAPDSVPDTLQAIFQAANAANLSVDHAEYHMGAEPVGELSRYDVVLPLKGRYGDLRQFLAQILAEHANVALGGVTFSRQAATEIGVEAQVRLILYLRGRE